MRWPRNIRSRLALGYALAVAVTVLLYAAVVYGFTQSSWLEQLDARLHADFEHIEHAFEVAADGSLHWKEVERSDHPDTSGEAPWAAVLHPSGGTDLRRPVEQAKDAGPWRIYEKDYPIGSQAYTIRVARSTAPLDTELRELLTLLALCLLPVMGLAWLGGRWLARRALRPVEVMTERARHIGAARLSERLPVAQDDELGRLATVFNEAFARLESSFVRLQRFTSDAAHELRTPLAALRAVGEVGLGAPPDASDAREVIASMLEETQQLTRLVEELLELSRGDAQAGELARAPVDLVVLAQGVCERLDVLAAERGQTLSIEGSTGLVVQGDAGMLRRAVANLVDNAIRHGPASSSIRVRIAQAGNSVSLSVEDDGPGIAPEHRERVFDRFYRGDAARTGTSTGLGLSLAAQAVARHGGRLELLVGEAGGSMFRITLPYEAPAPPR